MNVLCGAYCALVVAPSNWKALAERSEKKALKASFAG